MAIDIWIDKRWRYIHQDYDCILLLGKIYLIVLHNFLLKGENMFDQVSHLYGIKFLNES